MARVVRPAGEDHERGAVAIVTALCASLLLIAGGLLLDFGLVRVDRQVHKSAADAAVRAGIHGLDVGDSTPHPYAGVCAAIRYLKRSDARFAGIDESVGWTDGSGAATLNGCADANLLAKGCIPTNKTTWARFVWNGTLNGKPIQARIESGYLLSSTGWVEDGLSASMADANDQADGCNQLAVTISHARAAGLGSLATSSDLETAIRSVGRVAPGPGGAAPAMLILKRTGCPLLLTGSASADTSWIHVFGAQSSSGQTQPGTVHADSDGSGCSHPDSILGGRQNNGIVAYSAPKSGQPTVADPSKPGQITTFAGTLGVAPARIYDNVAYVYSSAALDPAGAGAAAKMAPTGRTQVTRFLHDQRYRAGVAGVRDTANGVFTNAPTDPAYKKFPATVDPCAPTQAEVDALALTAADSFYIACTGGQPFKGTGSLTINAGRVVFGGFVAPTAVVSLPNSRGTYIAGTPGKTALTLSGGTTGFTMHTTGNMSGSLCATGQSTNKAVLVVKGGSISIGNNSTFRLCRTTVLMMGGPSDACLPASDGTAPTSTPCAGALGTGQVDQSADAIVDWVAPDQYDLMTLPDGTDDPAKSWAWADATGPEDLALWSESATSTSVTSRLGGGGTFQVQGVFMTPNTKLLIGGGASLNLRDAQFVAESINLNGSGSKIDMSVDPNSAVTLPTLSVVGLVR